MSNYKSKNHSKFTLKYHIIFVCKYRKKLLIKYGEEIKQIIKDISYKYDFDILEIEIIVVNNEKTSPEQELVNDLISIIHVFSCRIYGLRKYKKQIEGDGEIAKELQNRDKSNS